MKEIKKPINIQDEQQRHYTELSEKLDAYDTTDKYFMLWYILQDYIKEMKSDVVKYSNVLCADDYLKLKMAKDQLHSAEEIREMLYYSIF